MKQEALVVEQDEVIVSYPFDHYTAWLLKIFVSKLDLSLLSYLLIKLDLPDWIKCQMKGKGTASKEEYGCLSKFWSKFNDENWMLLYAILVAGWLHAI